MLSAIYNMLIAMQYVKPLKRCSICKAGPGPVNALIHVSVQDCALPLQWGKLIVGLLVRGRRELSYNEGCQMALSPRSADMFP